MMKIPIIFFVKNRKSLSLKRQYVYSWWKIKIWNVLEEINWKFNAKASFTSKKWFSYLNSRN